MRVASQGEPALDVLFDGIAQDLRTADGFGVRLHLEQLHCPLSDDFVDLLQRVRRERRRYVDELVGLPGSSHGNRYTRLVCGLANRPARKRGEGDASTEEAEVTNHRIALEFA